MKTLLELATDITSQSKRGSEYGNPLDGFHMEAELMNTWIKYRYRGQLGPTRLDWKDMAMDKIFSKIVRESHDHKLDNLVDIAGYAQVIQWAIDEEDKRRGRS